MGVLQSVYDEAISIRCLHLLMNKDIIVAKLDITSNHTNKEYNQKLPYGYEDIISWLKKRRKFLCTRDAKEFFKSIGIVTDEDFIEVTHCISLSDSFWIKRIDSELKWKDVSPWCNDYSRIISSYALDGIIIDSDKNYFSPVIGTSGSFPHTWKYNNGSITFVKAGSKYTLGGINSGREPFSEYYASVIARSLGLDCVTYSIRNHTRADGRLDVVTECPIYTSESIGSISACDLGLNSYEDIINFAKCKIPNCYLKVINMLFLDCLLLNTDRHYGNIEFLIDNSTLEIIDIAPIFDNNYSLLPRFIEEMEEFNREDYRARDGRRFEDLYKMISKYKDFKPLLLRAKEITLKHPKSVSLSDSRLKFLNNLLQKQIDYLLRL